MYLDSSQPPSTTRVCPTTKLASSEQRKATTDAISDGWPTRPSGVASHRTLRYQVSSAIRYTVIGVSMTPGAMAFTITPSGASSAAIWRVSWATPAFDTE